MKIIETNVPSNIPIIAAKDVSTFSIGKGNLGESITCISGVSFLRLIFANSKFVESCVIIIELD